MNIPLKVNSNFIILFIIISTFYLKSQIYSAYLFSPNFVNSQGFKYLAWRWCIFMNILIWYTHNISFSLSLILSSFDNYLICFLSLDTEHIYNEK